MTLNSYPAFRTKDAGATVREVWRDSDLPENGRDFDYEGDWDGLMAELDKDAIEFGCHSYIVNTHGEGLYRVWRNQ